MAKTIDDIVHESYNKIIWGWCDNRAEAQQYFCMGCRAGLHASFTEEFKNAMLE